MKHLLTALIAALALVIPLNADEPPKHPSVRVIDHQGQPVEGLIFQFFWSKDGSDPFDARGDERPDIIGAVTDAQGRAIFSKVLLNQVTKDASLAVVPSTFGLLALDLAPEAERRVGDRHSELTREYAIDLLYRLDTEQLLSGETVIQLPEAVRFTFRLNPDSDRQTASVQRKGGLFRFAINGGAQELDSFELMIPRGKPAEIGVLYQHHFSILEFTAEQTQQPRVIEDLVRMEPIAKDASVSYTARAWQPQGSPTHLFMRSDGSTAQYFSLPPSISRDNDGQLTDHRWDISYPSGEYVVAPPTDKTRFLSTMWESGDIFDTLLRLRRGEDLPHLKRITIPEGGTVELSTEDFLDEPADQPQPADPR